MRSRGEIYSAKLNVVDERWVELITTKWYTTYERFEKASVSTILDVAD
jgi:hypothetical protein